MGLRIGFIGAGGIARHHMQRIAQVEGAEVAAICDVQEERARQSGSTYGCPVFTDWRQMLNDQPLEGVYIAVPPHAHEGQEQACAEKGIGMMIEKPIANSLATAREIEEVIDRSGVPNGVGYHWRYYKQVDQAREMIDVRSLALINGYWCGNFPGVAWWRRKDQSGGQFVEQTTHIVDLARYLVGEISEVNALFANSTMTDVEAFDIWDAGVVTVRFESGLPGAFMNTCALPCNHLVGLHLLGQKGAFEIDGPSLKVISQGQVQEFKAGDDPYLTQANAFCRALRGEKDQLRSPYSDAVKTLAVTLAATESSLAGRPVKT